MQREQAVLAMKNNEITIRGEKNGLLPVVDAFGFYGTGAIGGTALAYGAISAFILSLDLRNIARLRWSRRACANSRSRFMKASQPPG